MVSITNLAGTNFTAGATVSLNQTGFSDIAATGVNVVSPTQITCTFDPTNKIAVTYNVVVTKRLSPGCARATRPGSAANPNLHCERSDRRDAPPPPRRSPKHARMPMQDEPSRRRRRASAIVFRFSCSPHDLMNVRKGRRVIRSSENTSPDGFGRGALSTHEKRPELKPARRRSVPKRALTAPPAAPQAAPREPSPA